MPDPDTTWIVAQLLGFVALLCGLGAFAQKSDLDFKRKMTFFCCVEAVHFLLLGAASACLGCLLNGLRSFASARTRSPRVMLMFLAALWILGILSIAGFDLPRLWAAWKSPEAGSLSAILLAEPFRYLPLIGSSLGTVGLFLMSGVRLRFAILICSSLWLTHNLIAVSIGPSIMEVTFIIMNLNTIRRLLRDRRRARTPDPLSSVSGDRS